MISPKDSQQISQRLCRGLERQVRLWRLSTSAQWPGAKAELELVSRFYWPWRIYIYIHIYIPHIIISSVCIHTGQMYIYKYITHYMVCIENKCMYILIYHYMNITEIYYIYIHINTLQWLSRLTGEIWSVLKVGSYLKWVFPRCSIKTAWKNGFPPRSLMVNECWWHVISTNLFSNSHCGSICNL